MELRGKLLVCFISITLAVLVIFGISAYEIAYNSAIEKEKALLSSSTRQISVLLADHYKENRSLTPLLSHLTDAEDSGHARLLVESRKNTLIPANRNTILGVDIHRFPLGQMLRSDADSGHLTLDGRLYIWAIAPIKGTSYRLLHIFRSDYEISGPFAGLASRMFVAGLIIIWIAGWIALIISTKVTRRLQAQTEALRYQATHDSLTDLPNRTLLYDSLEQAIQTAKRKNKSVALIMMDLDRFKEINDTLGHHIGDQLLQKLGRRLQKTLWGSDTIARLGGDEFALLLPMADSGHSMRVVNKILEAITQPIDVEELSLEIEASLGIALYPEHGSDADSLMRHADVAMYLAKTNNDIYTFYEPGKDSHSLERLAIIGELRHAMARNELLLYYQPKIDIKTGCVIGAEALLRWQHPQRGLVLPNNFIPLAEQSGIIKPLTLWVIDAAIKQCASWHADGIPISVSVNLSSRVLQDIRLPAEVALSLKKYGLKPDSLELEITETAIMLDPARAQEVLQRLGDKGIRLSIDDFGTGYTCLAYLNLLPVNEIKIDRSFVMNMLSDKNDTEIVRAIIELAHNMGFGVVAEGVEDKAILDQLAHLDCDTAQGFYFSQPLPVDEFVNWSENTSLPAAPAADSADSLALKRAD